MTRLIASAIALVGFAVTPTSASHVIKATAAAKAQPTCVTVDARDIGKLPLTVNVGAVRVDFTGWKTRAVDSAESESVGFSIKSTGPLTWVAESGERDFVGSGTDFLDELALVKADAPTLRRITFCDQAP